MLDALHNAGIELALLVLSDLYDRSVLLDLAAHAEQLGYLLGPYDSYHFVHSPNCNYSGGFLSFGEERPTVEGSAKVFEDWQPLLA